MTVQRIFLSLFLFLNGILLQAETAFQFAENKGQSHENVRYEASLPGGKIFLEDHLWTFNFTKTQEHHHFSRKDIYNATPATDPTPMGHAYRVHFNNAREGSTIRPLNPFSHYNNYFIGNDPDKWASEVRLFRGVLYQDLYDLVDMHVYSRYNSLKYDFIVHPGGSVDDIEMEYEGVDKIYIKNKNLIIQTSINEIKEVSPYAYQIINGETKEVKCRFVLNGNKLRFVVPRGYNPNYDLIIDPELIFSTYTGSLSDNWGFTATYDDDGNAYGGGIAFSVGYPLTMGAWDVTFANNPNTSPSNTTNYGYDMAISKIAPDGSSLLYSTYLGGTGSESPHSLVVNSKNELVILGSTSSSNFPMVGGYDTQFAGGPAFWVHPYVYLSQGDIVLGGQDHLNGTDIVVAILNPNGNAVVGSTFFGGNDNDGLNTTYTEDVFGDPIYNLQFNYGDEARGEVIVDENDNIYIGSCTYSNTIPGTKGFQASNDGELDGVIAKFNDDVSSLDWMTFLGGNENDAVYSVKVAENGEVYACGGTQGAGFPITQQSCSGGSADGYIVRVSNNGQNLLGSTCLGASGSQYDQTYFVEIDKDGFIYTVGQSTGVYNVVGNVYSNSNTHQFIHKLSSNLANTEWSTTFGAGNSINISPTGLLVDNCGNIYVSGWGGGTNVDSNDFVGTTFGLPTSPDAFQSFTDGADLYFMILSRDAQSFEYGTFFGEQDIASTDSSEGQEHVDGGTSRFDKTGVVYHAVCASCSDTGEGSDNFPTTTGAWSNENPSDNCNLAVLKFDFQLFLEANADLEPAPEGCAPHTVNFTNLSDRWEDIYWDFGDGSPISTEVNPTHIYTDIGVFEVMMIIVDSATCNIADTSFLTINVPEFSEDITADLDTELPLLCEPYEVDFFNLSQYDGATEEYTFLWDFGNGVTSDEFEPIYEYPTFGTYNVSLTVTGPPPCNDQNTLFTTITIEENPIVSADFNYPNIGCIPFPVSLEALDEAEEYFWDLGDGTTSEDASLEHVYTEEGIYEITLIAVDTSTCNDTDTAFAQIEVYDNPIAAFTFQQDQPYILVDIPFMNQSTLDMEYLWDFGDGNTSTEFEPTHQFLQVGENEICLTVTRPDADCSDIYCETIFISDDFSIMMPTAFSPNGDGMNDEWVIQGFGVENFRLLVFNRWGEKVFEADSFGDSWNGIYKGVPQELGVFVYFVEATVAGGRKFFDEGNFTLLR